MKFCILTCHKLTVRTYSPFSYGFLAPERDPASSPACLWKVDNRDNFINCPENISIGVYIFAQANIGSPMTYSRIPTYSTVKN